MSDPDDVMNFLRWYVQEKLKVEETVQVDSTIASLCADCDRLRASNEIVGDFVLCMSLVDIADTSDLGYDFEASIPGMMIQCDKSSTDEVKEECVCRSR